jgi:hypothetical protein
MEAFIQQKLSLGFPERGYSAIYPNDQVGH